MITKEQRLALSSKGYDVAFERNGRIFAVKTNAINNWTEEKKAEFSQETGLHYVFLNNEWVFYNPKQYCIVDDFLRYIGTDEKPEQPINYTNYTCLFHSCKAKSLDLSHWDVSNVSVFKYLFYNCSNLKFLDVSQWDVSNVKFFSATFCGCKSLRSLPIETWDVSNGQEFTKMFCECRSLQSLDLNTWNVSRSDDFEEMFYRCRSLQSLDVSNWEVNQYAYFEKMFFGCTKLQSLDLSKWCVNRGTHFAKMFSDSGLEKHYGKSSNQLARMLKQGEWANIEMSQADEGL